MTPSLDDWKRAAKICREVAELPDRTSPEENADFMLVTGDELQPMLAEGFASERARIIAALREPDVELVDAMRAAASYRLDLPAGIDGEREKYRRRIAVVADWIENQRAKAT